MTTAQRKQLSWEEYSGLLKAQGVPREHSAFKCARCGHIQSYASMAELVGAVQAMGTAYFFCAGRLNQGVGCDWTLFDMSQPHTMIIVNDDGTISPIFEPATPEEAQALMHKTEASMRRCRICGCTEFHGCPCSCHWVEQDLCSACVGMEGI